VKKEDGIRDRRQAATTTNRSLILAVSAVHAAPALPTMLHRMLAAPIKNPDNPISRIKNILPLRG
jgi:hypothetical protein